MTEKAFRQLLRDAGSDARVIINRLYTASSGDELPEAGTLADFAAQFRALAERIDMLATTPRVIPASAPTGQRTHRRHAKITDLSSRRTA